jgi:zinc protease
VTPSIRELSQRFDGSAAPRDLETAMQLIYLYATQPKVDENTVKAAKDAAAADLANRNLDPSSALQDALTRLEYGSSSRWNPVLPLDAIQSIDDNQALQVYKDRFADMSDFTFTFVGNFDPKQVTELAQRYLGNLPGKGATSNWRDNLPPLPQGIQKQDVYKGQNDFSEAVIAYMGGFDATPEQQMQLRMLGDILRIRLTDQLRQKMSATYSPSASSRVDLWPETRYTLGIDFTDQPTKTQALLDATFAQIADLRANGPTATELAAVKEQERRSHESELTTNSYWLSLLSNYGIDPSQDPRQSQSVEALIDGITTADLKAAANQFLKPDQYIQAVLYPAAMQPAPTSGEAHLVR